MLHGMLFVLRLCALATYVACYVMLRRPCSGVRLLGMVPCAIT